VSGSSYAADFNEVKRLGGDGTNTPSTRTPDETEVAQFWNGSSALMWNRIARTVSEGSSLDLWTSARMFALLNMVMVDGLIASWDAKYLYSSWRPITAIQLAETDGNATTQGDAAWTPLAITPPFPEYDSLHGVQSGAAGQVLSRVLGANIGFDTCSSTLPVGNCGEASPKLRHYSSFSQAVNESGISRILVGANFRKAVNEGLRHGLKIGNRAVDRLLLPV
jgi:hypothetical protein